MTKDEGGEAAPNGGSQTETGPERRRARRATQVAVGAASFAWNRLAPARRGRRLRNVAVGLVFDVEDVMAALAVEARLRAVDTRYRLGLRTADARERLRQRLDVLAQRGALEEEQGRRRAAEIIGAIAEAVATSPTVDRAIDAQLDRTVRPLLVKVLDDVLGMLEAEPERVQGVIRGQRDSMVDELVDNLRGGAAAGDAVVDRLTARILGRPVAPAAQTADAEPS